MDEGLADGARAALQAKGYEMDVLLPEASSVHTTFPFTMGWLSAVIAAARVYPALGRHMLGLKEAAGGPVPLAVCMEVYSPTKQLIDYFVPLEHAEVYGAIHRD